MPAIVIPINKTVDISQGCLETTLGLANTKNALIQGQSYAHQLNVAVINAGTPVELSGVCTTNFLRQADSSTVTVAGTINGNVASVEFPSMVYAMTGMLTITLFIGDTAIIRIETSVRMSGTMSIVDPGNILPNVTEMQQIALEAEQATVTANTASSTANAAAGNANAAAENANAAISGVTATATTLSAGASATASAALVEGAWQISIGVPTGPQGPKGDPGDGDVSSVDSVLPVNGNVPLQAFCVRGSTTDANTALTVGVYNCTTSTANIPVSQFGYLVNVSTSFTFNNQTGIIDQFFVPIGGGTIWRRSAYNTTTWNSWHPMTLDAYPVGAIYMSTVSTSPASLFGGEWAQISDTFLVGAGTTYLAGSTGGSASVTLAGGNLPAVQATPARSTDRFVTMCGAGDSPDGYITPSDSGTLPLYWSGNWGTKALGSGTAFNTTPPYQAVYMWQRTA